LGHLFQHFLSDGLVKLHNDKGYWLLGAQHIFSFFLIMPLYFHVTEFPMSDQ
jgi:hypothetical protein